MPHAPRDVVRTIEETFPGSCIIDLKGEICAACGVGAAVTERLFPAAIMIGVRMPFRLISRDQQVCTSSFPERIITFFLSVRAPLTSGRATIGRELLTQWYNAQQQSWFYDWIPSIYVDINTANHMERGRPERYNTFNLYDR